VTAATVLDQWTIGEFDYNRMPRGMLGRKTWALNQPEDYVYQIEQHCYCPGPPKAEVFVVAGKVAQIKDSQSGQVITDPSQLRRFKTVPQLFEQIDRILAAKPDSVTLKLDRYLGYPARFTANPSYRMADEEIDYRINWLKPLIKRK